MFVLRENLGNLRLDLEKWEVGTVKLSEWEILPYFSHH